MSIVISARDAAACLRLGKVELVLAELRIQHDLLEHLHHGTRVVFERVEGNAPAGLADAALYRGRDVLQLLIELITRLVFGPARTHDGARELREADLVGRIEEVAGSDQRKSADQRQL